MSAPRARSASRPRAINERLAKISKPTPRASDLTEAGPESNEPRGSSVAVESTRTSPGAGGTAVVVEPRSIAAHTDDDARIVVGDDGEARLVEPPALERAAGQPEGDGSLEGDDNTSDPRDDVDDDPAADNDNPNAEGSPAGAPEGGSGESMTSERVAGQPAGEQPAKRGPARGKGPSGS